VIHVIIGAIGMTDEQFAEELRVYLKRKSLPVGVLYYNQDRSINRRKTLGHGFFEIPEDLRKKLLSDVRSTKHQV
jgi:hypothetical protein